MLFNSYEFIFVFLPISLLGHHLAAARSRTVANAWLVACSLFFYGWWDARFLGLLLLSIGMNYAFGHVIHAQAREGRGREAGWALIGGVVLNLGLLGYFKYLGFILAFTTGFTDTSFALSDVVLPLGISFYTFTQIAYLVDVRRGIVGDYKFLNYALFVTYFPHLLAGPIIHHKEMMPQFLRPMRHLSRCVAVGLSMFALGLFKKVVLADSLAHLANPMFAAVEAGAKPDLIDSWVGALGYTFQLYFDFSGYCDMAIGASLMFGIRLPINFNSPYKACSIIDFWRRWHMTLSRFLRDYLYVPLGGNRHGTLARYRNLMITMFLGGLWHGAGWTFILWGSLHGVYLVANQLWRTFAGRYGLRLPSLLAWALTFVAVVVAWVFFRAQSVDAAAQIIQGMIGLNGIVLPESYAASFAGWADHIPLRFSAPLINAPLQDRALWLFGAAAITFFMCNSQELLRRYHPAMGTVSEPRLRWRWRPTFGWAAALVIVFLIPLLALNRLSEFLYYQF